MNNNFSSKVRNFTSIKRTLLSIAFLALMLPAAAQAALPAGFSTEVVAGGLNLPTTFDFAPDSRIFVAEKGGVVRVIKNGELLPTPFLTLSNINTWADRGLIGLAVDPNFDQNGYIYLSYTYENSPADFEGPKMARIVRVTANGDVMEPGSMVVLVGTEVGDASTPSCNDFPAGTDCIPSDSGSHSAGGLRFGPDDKLYATLGDGASFAFVDPNAYKTQDFNWLTGKVLRLNRDGTAPADNPFYTGDPNDNQSKIYAYGLRNSFRFDFRPSNDSLFAGEVGWGGFEEINVIRPGDNLAWPCREGFGPQGGYQCTAENYKDPIYVYPNDGAASIVGGAFAGAAYPAEYQGSYFFGDFYRSDITRMKISADDTTVLFEEKWFDGDADGPVAILAGPDGSLYYASIFNGEIRHIKYTGGGGTNEAPVARDDAATALSGEVVYITLMDNDTDPNDDPLTLGPLSTPAQGAVYNNGDNTVTYVAPAGFVGTDTFSYEITDGSLTDSALVTIDVRPNADPALVNIAHVSLTQDVATPVVGETTTFSATVRNDGEAGPFLVDFELYDAADGSLENSKVFNNEFIDVGETRTYTWAWTPQQSGLYWLSTGYLSPDWSILHHWEDMGLQFNVLDRKPPTNDPLDLVIDGISISDAAISLGDPISATVTITNNGGDGTGLVDIEVTNEAVEVVHMEFFESEFFTAGETRTFTTTWTPSELGHFFVDAGTFGAGWHPFMNWAWHGAEFDVTESSTGGSSNYIYDDSFSENWASWSWDTTIDFANIESPYVGSNAMEVTYGAPWGGVYFRADTPFLKESFTSLAMSVSGYGLEGQELVVKIIDPDGTILHEDNIPALTDDWSTFATPLASITSTEQIAGIFIMGRSGTTEETYLVDELRFE